jgi:type I restriction enzyme S subunit
MIALNGQGKTRGTVALLRTEATCNQSLVSISPNDESELLAEFLFYNLKMRYQELRRMTGDDGDDRRGLNMILIRNIEIPLMSIENQHEIVKKLDSAFMEIELLRSKFKKEKENVMALRQSLLSSAFTPEESVT